MVGWKYVVANTLAEVEKLRNEVRDFYFVARSRNGDRVFAVKETSVPEEVKRELCIGVYEKGKFEEVWM